jgi:uncharacterized damage-inducible protein DinB
VLVYCAFAQNCFHHDFHHYFFRAMLLIERPQSGEYPAYFGNYLQHLPAPAASTASAASDEKSLDIAAIAQATHRQTQELLGSLSDEQLAFRYADGKWTIREIIGHLIDAERIFAYRLLRIARGDTTPLAGFDENMYVPASNATNRSVHELLSEFAVVRASSLALLRGLAPEAFALLGTASEKPVSVRALAWVIVGHEMHHLGIIRERYLKLS